MHNISLLRKVSFLPRLTDWVLRITQTIQNIVGLLGTFNGNIYSIMIYFRIMVLVEGKVREYAAPADLLADSNSLFFLMAKDAGLI